MGLQQRLTLHRKQESRSKEGTVFKSCPKHTVEFLTANGKLRKVASRNYAEISQKVVNISIPCTQNAQQPMAAFPM